MRRVDDATAGVAGAVIAGGTAVKVDESPLTRASTSPSTTPQAMWQSLCARPSSTEAGKDAVELLNRLRVEDEEEVTPFDANDATALGLFAAIVGPCLERQLMVDRHELWAGAAQ